MNTNELQERLCEHIDDLLDVLGVEYRYATNGHSIFGPCPIHCGDNPTAFTIYPTGHSLPGYWKCHSRGCEREYKATILGFVRGVLSKNGRKATFKQTVRYCQDFLRGRATAKVKPRKPKPERKQLAISRDDVRGTLQIPARYYLRRGFSQAVLDYFDVGFYPHKGRTLSGRVAIPVYHDGVAVGFTGRSAYDDLEPRWLHHGFSKSNYLYGLWSAKAEIERTGRVILVEGPSDVWRLWEAGMTNAVALMGSSLSDAQQSLLEQTGASEWILAFDGDMAGRMLSTILRDRFPTMTKVVRLPNGLDVSDMTDHDELAALMDCQ